MSADDRVAQANSAAIIVLAEFGHGTPFTAELPAALGAVVATARATPTDPGAAPWTVLSTPTGRRLSAHASPLVGRSGAATHIAVTITPTEHRTS